MEKVKKRRLDCPGHVEKMPDFRLSLSFVSPAPGMILYRRQRDET